MWNQLKSMRVHEKKVRCLTLFSNEENKTLGYRPPIVFLEKVTKFLMQQKIQKLCEVNTVAWKSQFLDCPQTCLDFFRSWLHYHRYHELKCSISFAHRKLKLSTLNKRLGLLIAQTITSKLTVFVKHFKSSHNPTSDFNFRDFENASLGLIRINRY